MVTDVRMGVAGLCESLNIMQPYLGVLGLPRGPASWDRTAFWAYRFGTQRMQPDLDLPHGS